MSVSVAYAFANVAQSTTDAVLVGAMTGAKIRVIKVAVVAGATATNVTFNSKLGAAAGVAISATFACGINGGFVLPGTEVNIRAESAAADADGWFETTAGQALTVTTGAGSTVGIQIAYIVV